MKKCLVVLSLILSLTLVFSVPAFAYTWPPEKYEMPRTVLTTEEMGQSLSGLKDSIRSIGNTGLTILGICLSIFLVPFLLNHLVLNNISSRKKNGPKSRYSSGTTETAGSLEISGSHKSRGLAWRSSHSESGLEEQIYQRESSYSPGEFSEGAQRVRPHRRRRP